MFHDLCLPILAAAPGPESLLKIREAIVTLIALVLSITVHEFGHAFVADKLGDRTPRSQGRVTLNPLVHADPIGTVLFPLIGMFTGMGIFGWGRPVMVYPPAFTRKLRMKVAHMFVALAGPAMNAVLALIVTAVYAVTTATRVLPLGSELGIAVIRVISLNWVLLFFNLIPVPPLDGGTILAGLLPDRYQHVVDFLRQYGFMILLAMMLVPQVFSIFLAPAGWLTSACVGLAHAIAF